MGAVTSGGSGCVCPSALRGLVLLTLHRDEVVILDMEAGIEHLGRATASAVDAFIVVVEPGLRSVQTANSVRSLARDIGVTNILAVGNKVRGERDEQFLREHLADVPLLGFIPFLDDVIEADIAGTAAYHTVPELASAVRAIVEELEE